MSEEKQRFSGRDLAEAIAAARRHFGVTRAELGFEVVHAGKIGLVGGGTPTVEIDAWRREGGAPPQPPRDEASGFDRPRGRGGERRGGREDRGPRGGGGGGRERGGRGGGFGGSRRGRDDHDEFRPPLRGGGGAAPRERDDAPVALTPLLPPADIADQRAIVEQLARSLVGGLGLTLEFQGLDETSAGLRVKLDGEDVPLLLESEAEGLEALQYLANRILQKDGRIPNRISFDAGGHRARAEAKLVAEALAAAEEVRQTGQPKKMAALGPYERRLVHVALADAEGIKTFSTGSGYHRRLHIAPADGPGSEEPGDAEADAGSGGGDPA